MAHLNLAALVVRDYDAAIRFFVDVLQFELVEDVPSLTNDGRPKRWVVVRPIGGTTGLLLAKADGAQQLDVVGRQFAGRVGFFVRVDNFEATYARMAAAGVTFVTQPRVESYGAVAVFLDLEGNRWDLLGPAPGTPRDILFLLTGGFADPAHGGGAFHCTECAQIEGLLSYFPKLRETLDVRYIPLARPRTDIVSLLGEAHQNCPMLVVADLKPEHASLVTISDATGRAFCTDAAPITRYLMAAHGVSAPHP